MISVTTTWPQSTDRGRNCCLPTPTAFVMWRPMICIAISHKTWNTLTRQNTRENISCIVRETKKCWKKWKTRPMGYLLRSLSVFDPRCTPFYSLKKTHLWERKQQKLFPRTSLRGNFGIKIINFVSSKNTNKMNQIRSGNHQIYSLTLIKTSLLSYGDKRYIVTDSFHTVAYGNYKGLGIKFYACK